MSWNIKETVEYFIYRKNEIPTTYSVVVFYRLDLNVQSIFIVIILEMFITS